MWTRPVFFCLKCCLWLHRCSTLTYIHQHIDYLLRNYNCQLPCAKFGISTVELTWVWRALIIEPWDSASYSVDIALAFTFTSLWFNIFPVWRTVKKHDTNPWYFWIPHTLFQRSNSTNTFTPDSTKSTRLHIFHIIPIILSVKLMIVSLSYNNQWQDAGNVFILLYGFPESSTRWDGAWGQQEEAAEQKLCVPEPGCNPPIRAGLPMSLSNHRALPAQ